MAMREPSPTTGLLWTLKALWASLGSGNLYLQILVCLSGIFKVLYKLMTLVLKTILELQKSD